MAGLPARGAWQRAGLAEPHSARGTNLGLAHGAAGPVGLLATAALSSIEVPGWRAALGQLLAFYDTWQHTDPAVWWPEWITDNDHHPHHPARPSWCYGTPGIAWAHHLAARALGDRDRQRTAERALLETTAANQLARLTHPGLCHGQAGHRLILTRAADHALLPRLRSCPLPALSPSTAPDPGLLDGQAGLDLAQSETTTWANCLLLGRTPVDPSPHTADS